MKNLIFITLIALVTLFAQCKKPEPEVSFTLSKTSAEVGETISFTNATLNATSYEWEFGDGKTSTDENPKHSYSTDGTFTVSLTATGEGGTNTKTLSITILPKLLSYDDGTFEEVFDAEPNWYRFYVRFDKPSGWDNVKITKIKIKFSSSGSIKLLCYNWKTSSGTYFPKDELYYSDEKAANSGWNEWNVNWTLNDDRFFVGYYQPGLYSPDLYYDTSNSDERSYMYYYYDGFMRTGLFTDIDWAIQVHVEPGSDKKVSNSQKKGVWLNSKHVKKENPVVNKNQEPKFNVTTLKKLEELK